MFDYPEKLGPVGPVEVRPGRPHGGQRRPRDLLGPERRSPPTTAQRLLPRHEQRALAERADPAGQPGQAAVIDDLRDRWEDLPRAVRIVGGAALAAALIYALYNAPGTGPYLDEKAPWGIVVAGVIVGTVTALLAMGLILIYRTNRFINFAYGSMGSFAGVIAIGLHKEQGVNFFVALPDRRGHRRGHRRARRPHRAPLPDVVPPDPHRGQHRHRPDAGRGRAAHHHQDPQLHLADGRLRRSRSTWRSTWASRRSAATRSSS